MKTKCLPFTMTGCKQKRKKRSECKSGYGSKLSNLTALKLIILVTFERMLVGGFLGGTFAAANGLAKHYTYANVKFTTRILRRLGNFVLKGSIVGMILGSTIGFLINLI